MEYTFKLTYDQIDEIVVKTLLEDYKMLKGNVNTLKRLEKNNDLTDVQQEDLLNNKKYCKAIKKVLKYYLTSEAFETAFK